MQVWALLISITSVAISPFLPYWMGGTAEIARDASLYFGIFGAFLQKHLANSTTFITFAEHNVMNTNMSNNRYQ